MCTLGSHHPAARPPATEPTPNFFSWGRGAPAHPLSALRSSFRAGDGAGQGALVLSSSAESWLNKAVPGEAKAAKLRASASAVPGTARRFSVLGQR